MKTKIRREITMVLAFAWIIILLPGCCTAGDRGIKSPRAHSRAYWRSDPLAPIGMSQLPPDPVRRSSTSVDWWGYRREDSQGTATQVQKTWVQGQGTFTTGSQTSWRSDYRSYYPPVYPVVVTTDYGRFPNITPSYVHWP